jgi:hypothetical protein
MKPQSAGALGQIIEDGNLGLATVTPEGLQVLATASVLENVAWAPTSP